MRCTFLLEPHILFHGGVKVDGLAGRGLVPHLRSKGIVPLSMADGLTLTGFVWKNLRRRRLRTLLTLGGIGMAVGAFVGLVGFSSSFEQQWMQHLLEQRHRHRRDSRDISEHIDGRVATDKLKAVPVVAAASPVIFNVMDLTPDVNALVYGWKADAFQLDSLQILSGRRFRDGAAGGDAGRLAGAGPEEERRRHGLKFRGRPSRWWGSTTRRRRCRPMR